MASGSSILQMQDGSTLPSALAPGPASQRKRATPHADTRGLATIIPTCKPATFIFDEPLAYLAGNSPSCRRTGDRESRLSDQHSLLPVSRITMIGKRMEKGDVRPPRTPEKLGGEEGKIRNWPSFREYVAFTVCVMESPFCRHDKIPGVTRKTYTAYVEKFQFTAHAKPPSAIDAAIFCAMYS